MINYPCCIPLNIVFCHISTMGGIIFKIFAARVRGEGQDQGVRGTGSTDPNKMLIFCVPVPLTLYPSFLHTILLTTPT